MAAEIKPMGSTSARTSHPRALTSEKPVLKSKIDATRGVEIHGVRLLAGGYSLITISDDKSVRVWQRRSAGQYWPSVCHYLPATPTALHYSGESRTLCVGLANGTLMEFAISEDENSLAHLRDYLAHQGRVTDLLFSGTLGWLLSTARDKCFCFYSTSTGHRLGGLELTSWVTCLELDPASCHAFVGDHSGCVSMVKLGQDTCTVVTKLQGHTSSIESVSWDRVTSQLFSGSSDHTVKVWDVGGGKGTAHHLHGHKGTVRAVQYCPSLSVLVTASEDGGVVWWDMAAQRLVSPAWSESDSCEGCHRPFFWNLREMINRKQIGLRQHHCRKCGKALCDACCSRRSVLPAMGFEFGVRVCEACFSSITDKDRDSLAVFQETKHCVVSIDLDLAAGVMVTAGTDQVIKIWDVKPLLAGS